MTSRLFFAVNIPDEAARAVARIIGDLRDRIRGAKASYARPEQAHVTLKFLGDVDDDKRALLATACEPVRRAARPFSMTLRGVGAFPDVRRPKVVWVGVGSGLAELAALAQGVDVATEPLGFGRETRAFTPHLTLARIKDRRSEKPVAAALEGLSDGDVGAMRVTSFELMQSVQKPDGVSYVRVHSFTLEE